MKRKDNDIRDEFYNDDEFDPSINRRNGKKRKKKNSRVRKTPIILTVVFVFPFSLLNLSAAWLSYASSGWYIYFHSSV